ncbi:MAG: 1,4-alpha-glucan branching enzyme, partial [Defluviitaleaceae bacterium]|nr:1,4-alpha-glucan branching enzyme [Defluviitaleaceae bacterium]
MISTVALHELRRLLAAEHAEPHNILGMHEIKHKMVPSVAVRAFIPQAEHIAVVDDTDKKGGTVYELVKIHADGFFEAVIAREKWFKYKLDIAFQNGDRLQTYDPYSFVPTISELDRYLFGEGTHYEIYDKLGAHHMAIDGVDGVSFTVWAPNA